MSGATLTIFLSLPMISSEPDFTKPTLLKIERQILLLPTLEAMTLFSKFTERYFLSIGCLTTLSNSLRMSLAAPSTSFTESLSTNSSNRILTRSVKRSRAEKENDAELAVLMSLSVNSSYFAVCSAVIAGWKGAALKRPSMKFFIISSDLGIPWNMWIIFPSRIPKIVGSDVTSKAALAAFSVSVLSFTNRKAPPDFTAISVKAGVRALHGPHQSA
mmetsp:Transcript_22117/g.54684  ORF Transcript_22117/g.54684 Transcript_22117/m.54684 type:complete len:216 (+) Transcript_22117:4193-4840(+)